MYLIEKNGRYVVAATMKDLKVEDALLYLDKVKAEYEAKPHIYDAFIKIVQKFKERSIDIPDVVKQVKTLFRSKPSLMLGFNIFLPEGHEIKLTLDGVSDMNEHFRGPTVTEDSFDSDDVEAAPSKPFASATNGRNNCEGLAGVSLSADVTVRNRSCARLNSSPNENEFEVSASQENLDIEVEEILPATDTMIARKQPAIKEAMPIHQHDRNTTENERFPDYLAVPATFQRDFMDNKARKRGNAATFTASAASRINNQKVLFVMGSSVDMTNNASVYAENNLFPRRFTLNQPSILTRYSQASQATDPCDTSIDHTTVRKEFHAPARSILKYPPESSEPLLNEKDNETVAEGIISPVRTKNHSYPTRGPGVSPVPGKQKKLPAAILTRPNDHFISESSLGMSAKSPITIPAEANIENVAESPKRSETSKTSTVCSPTSHSSPPSTLNNPSTADPQKLEYYKEMRLQLDEKRHHMQRKRQLEWANLLRDTSKKLKQSPKDTARSKRYESAANDIYDRLVPENRARVATNREDIGTTGNLDTRSAPKRVTFNNASQKFAANTASAFRMARAEEEDEEEDYDEDDTCSDVVDV